jgi:Gram-negative bacterial TonB protein C-terminal
MHWLIPLAALLALGQAYARETLSPTFRLSLEKWRSLCPAIETYEALSARGIGVHPVEFRPAFTRYSANPVGGVVPFDVRIDTDGIVRDLQVLGDHKPDLVGPALHAVSRWRFAPVLVGGAPTCVEAQLEVDVLPYAPRSRAWNGRFYHRSSPNDVRQN